jgi:hypothetical protein
MSPPPAASRPTGVVDMDANPIDGDRPFLPMLRDELYSVRSCVPQDRAQAL